jgi:hypothetical protein
VLKVLSAILVAIVAIFLAALGACLVIAGVGSLGQGLSGIGLALLCWLMAAAAFFGIARAVR